MVVSSVILAQSAHATMGTLLLIHGVAMPRNSEVKTLDPVRTKPSFAEIQAAATKHLSALSDRDTNDQLCPDAIAVLRAIYDAL